MSDPKAPPAPVDASKMRLEMIYFMPGVSVPAGLPGLSSLDKCWRLDKHEAIKPIEQKNGDVWLHHPNGRVTKLSPWMIAYTVMGPVKP